MRLLNIVATPHSFGNRIDLHWELPDSPAYPRVRVVRREGTHPTEPNPTSANEGIVVPEQADQNYAQDEGLNGETVYYYALFPYQTAGPNNTIVIDNASEQIDIHNRTAAMATAPYNFAGQMYSLLPAIYHRYDTILPRNPPPDMLTEDKQKGQLLRFLDLIGTQLDQSYSFARATLDLHKLSRVDGRLLPLLADWIGWKTDFSLEIGRQRNEIRNAPSVYQTIGIIPTVEATVKRISGWESRTKEFVHNVFVSNRPERLNIWAKRRSTTGTWSMPTQPLSLNFAYEGRPAAATDAAGTLWLFYHTLKKQGWNIWYKTSDDGGKTWTPSQPLTKDKAIYKHPSAVAQGTTLWVFWDVYDKTAQRWQINYRRQTAGTWSSILPLPDQVFPDPKEPFPDATSERRSPAAVADNAGGVWLFWLEKVGNQWQLKYNRHNGTNWQLASPAIFPLNAGADPRVEDDVFILFRPSSPNPQLWIYWARQEIIAPGQTRHSIVYRIKQSINPNLSDWSVIRSLPKTAPADYHDREPSVVLGSSNRLEVFWSSNQAGSWSIRRNTLNAGTFVWGSAETITTEPYSQRAPLPLLINNEILLVYRSNESLPYTSKVYGATDTVDFRYSGSTTVHIHNTAKLAFQGKFDDFQSYTYDAGQNRTRTNDDHIARDTVGLYLKPDITDPAKIKAVISRLKNVSAEFMPATDRAVFITP